MSQYKVLPPYSEINTINTEYEEDNSFVNFSLSYSSDDTASVGAGGQQVRMGWLMLTLFSQLIVIIQTRNFSINVLFKQWIEITA